MARPDIAYLDDFTLIFYQNNSYIRIPQTYLSFHPSDYGNYDVTALDNSDLCTAYKFHGVQPSEDVP